LTDGVPDLFGVEPVVEGLADGPGAEFFEHVVAGEAFGVGGAEVFFHALPEVGQSHLSSSIGPVPPCHSGMPLHVPQRSRAARGGLRAPASTLPARPRTVLAGAPAR